MSLILLDIIICGMLCNGGHCKKFVLGNSDKYHSNYFLNVNY